MMLVKGERRESGREHVLPMIRHLNSHDPVLDILITPLGKELRSKPLLQPARPAAPFFPPASPMQTFYFDPQFLTPYTEVQHPNEAPISIE